MIDEHGNHLITSRPGKEKIEYANRTPYPMLYDINIEVCPAQSPQYPNLRQVIQERNNKIHIKTKKTLQADIPVATEPSADVRVAALTIARGPLLLLIIAAHPLGLLDA